MKLQRLSFLLVALCASAVFAADKPDLSSPKSSALAFGNAMMSGDVAGMKASATGTEAEFKTMEAMSQMVSAMKKMSDAAEAKFGKDNVLSQGRNMAPDMAKELENSEIKVDGDTATIAKKGDAGPPMKLKKSGGEWKVDLSAMPKENMEQLVKMVGPMVKAANETTAEITAGKYKTADEAKDAMSQKMLAALMAAQGGAIPAPPPAPPAPEK